MAFGSYNKVARMLPWIRKLLAEGLTVHEVADRLGLNRSSVDTLIVKARARENINKNTNGQ